MFKGDAINATENRAVMHWLLRHPAEGAAADALPASVQVCLKEVHETLNDMLSYAEKIRSDEQITDVVNIGIGGSDLGPQMAVMALQSFALKGKRFHFVSNVDGHELDAVLKGLKSESTLFLIASKTFTTLETMTNAVSAKRWFESQGGTNVSRHFAALTTNVEAAGKFGIQTWRTPWISTFNMPMQHTICQCVWACSMFGIATFCITPAVVLRRITAHSNVSHLICSSLKWKAMASRLTIRVKHCLMAPRLCCGANPGPMGSTHFSKCCIKEPIWCR
jgi:hypothetical protein